MEPKIAFGNRNFLAKFGVHKPLRASANELSAIVLTHKPQLTSNFGQEYENYVTARTCNYYFIFTIVIDKICDNVPLCDVI